MRTDKIPFQEANSRAVECFHEDPWVTPGRITLSEAIVSLKWLICYGKKAESEKPRASSRRESLNGKMEASSLTKPDSHRQRRRDAG